MRSYIAIDLKSFYASVECVERGLDPLRTNLVVADESRTEKTICLAVSPSLKAYGIPGRARLFEVIQRVNQVNEERKKKAPGQVFSGSSYDAEDLKKDASLSLAYHIAMPRMAYYMHYSTRVYQVYLKYVAPEDIHVYSIDEVFIDATAYLNTYGLTAQQLAEKMVQDVLDTTGITATAGIGTNLYLCKIAMDIVAKHTAPNENGARIGALDEKSYRRLLWAHLPLTDFWRVGHGTVERLRQNGIYTMGDIARCSIENEDLLYRLFGVNAGLLIDHAWGVEPCMIADIKAYQPQSSSISSGQVLTCPYPFDKARLAVREMTDLLVLDLVAKKLVTNQMVLTVGYDIECLTDPGISAKYHGPISIDRYGRKTPKSAHGTIRLSDYTSSTKEITDAVMELFDRIVNPDLTVRRMYVVAGQVLDEHLVPDPQSQFEQLDLFTDYAAREEERKRQEEARGKERRLQQAALDIKKKFGKNAILKGMNLQQGATAVDRNGRIGGHKA